MSKANWATCATLALGLLLIVGPAPAQQPDYVEGEVLPVPQPSLPGPEMVPSPDVSQESFSPGSLGVPCPSGQCPLVGHPSGAALELPAGACCEVCGGGVCCPDDWYVDQAARMLSHSKPRGLPITLVFNGVSFIQIMNTRSAGFDAAPGYDATIGRYLGRDTDNRDQFLEFTFWGLNTWRESEGVRGATPNALYTEFPLDVGGFNRADDHWISHESEMNNYELNIRLRPRSRGDRLVLHPNGRWRRECQSGDYMSYLFGLRLLSVDETFRFQSRGVVNLLPVSGDYVVFAHNDVCGLQIGADYIHRACKWSWGVRTKVGPYVNFNDQFSRVVTYAASDPLATVEIDARRRAEKNTVALVGEVGFVGEYRIRPNMIVHAAYDFMWITGLALAPEQLVFEVNPPASINTNGLIYSHGLTLGMTVTW